MKLHVEPASGDVKTPPHPMEGPMLPEGSFWIADQYTLRLLADGTIRRKDGDTDEAALARMLPPPADPASPESEAAQGRRRFSTRIDAPAGASAPQEA